MDDEQVQRVMDIAKSKTILELEIHHEGQAHPVYITKLDVDKKSGRVDMDFACREDMRKILAPHVEKCIMYQLEEAHRSKKKLFRFL